MVPYSKTDWLFMLVSPRGSFAPGLLRRVLLFGLIATAVWFAHRCPLYASDKISSLLAGYARRGALAPPMAARVEEEVMILVNCLGGCERVCKTPTPLGYVLLLRRMVALYIATLRGGS